MGLMKFVLGFAVGFYGGVFVSQTYNIPNVNEVLKDLKKIANEYKKDKGEK